MTQPGDDTSVRLKSAGVLDAETLRRIAEGLPDTVVVTDDQGRILWVNAAMCMLLECAADELCGCAIEDLMPAEEVLKLSDSRPICPVPI